MGSCEGVVVVVKSTKVLVAVLQVTEHRLALSNLDLVLPPLDVGIFFCYDDGEKNNEMMISMVKKGLGQVKHWYLILNLCWEVVQNNQGEPEMLCNNRGVDFVEVTQMRCGGVVIGLYTTNSSDGENGTLVTKPTAMTQPTPVTQQTTAEMEGTNAATSASS